MAPPWKRYGWNITLLGVVVLAMHGYFLGAALYHRTYLTDDSIQYLTLAENLAHEGVFSQSFSAPYVPDLQRTPGYPVFLYLLGRDPALILIVQHLLVLGAVWFLYRAAREMYGARVAGAGAKIYLLQPYPIILASYVLSETLFIFLLLGGFWAYLRFWKGGGWSMLAIALGAVALAALVRPVALPLLVLAGLLALAHLYRLQHQRFLQAIVATLVPVLILGPWYWRNHAHSGKWTFSTMGEMGMLHGRLGALETWRTDGEMNEHQFYMAGDSVAALEMGLQHIRQYPEGKQTHETEQLAGGMGWLTLGFFLKHPWDAFRFELRCFWEMFTGVGYGWGRELILSKPVAMGFAGLQLLCNVFMYLGALLAMVRWREWTGPQKFTLWAIAVVLLVSAAGWADGRYRMVVDPLLMVLAMFTLRRQEKIHEAEPVVAVSSEAADEKERGRLEDGKTGGQ
jgi:4-amino-4-deoxy-L-arabinose transferase-like glycosyltransferase